jgi:hypothetical protein
MSGGGGGTDFVLSQGSIANRPKEIASKVEIEKAREILLGDDFGDVAVKVNGVLVEVHADGSVMAYRSGVGEALLPAANSDDAKPRAGGAPQAGDEMEDGTRYVGISPDTGAPFFAAAEDVPVPLTWRDAIACAVNCQGHGHPKGTFRVPSRNELRMLFNKRAVIGGLTGGVYWSAKDRGSTWADSLNFFDGRSRDCDKLNEFSVRLVRGR